MRFAVRTLVLGVALSTAAAGSAFATPVPLFNATATFSQTGFTITAASDGNSSSTTGGWAIFGGSGGTNPETGVWETGSDPTSGNAFGTLFTFVLYQMYTDPEGEHNVGRFRLSFTQDAVGDFADGLPSGGDVTANWTVLDPLTTVASVVGTTLAEQGDNSILASLLNLNGTYTITASTLLTGITGFRLETLADASLPFAGPGREPSNGNFVLTEFTVAEDALEQGPTSAVPEPATLLLFGTGLAAAGVRRYRQRQK